MTPVANNAASPVVDPCLPVKGQLELWRTDSEPKLQLCRVGKGLIGLETLERVARRGDVTAASTLFMGVFPAPSEAARGDALRSVCENEGGRYLEAQRGSDETGLCRFPDRSLIEALTLQQGFLGEGYRPLGLVIEPEAGER